MKTTLIYITLALIAFASAILLYKWMADEPILPRIEPIEKIDYSPSYEIIDSKG